MVIAEISADNETWNPFFSIGCRHHTHTRVVVTVTVVFVVVVAAAAIFQNFIVIRAMPFLHTHTNIYMSEWVNVLYYHYMALCVCSCSHIKHEIETLSSSLPPAAHFICFMIQRILLNRPPILHIFSIKIMSEKSKATIKKTVSICTMEKKQQQQHKTQAYAHAHTHAIPKWSLFDYKFS